MRNHEWFIEHRSAFVARSLDPGEEAAFAEHLQGCEECRQAVAELERDLGLLPMGVAPGVVDPALTRRMASRVIGENRWRWNNLTSVAAAAAVLLMVGAYQVGQRGRPAGVAVSDTLVSALQESESRRLALLDTLSVLRQANLIRQANFELDNREGGLMIFADERTHRWNVVVHGLPPAGPERKYQFWFITDDGMVRGAVVNADTIGPAVMTMDMPPTGGKVLGAALTVEPMDSTTAKPRGEELVHLIL
jgi:hypothetical protein